MTLMVAAKNTMLNALSIDAASLHTGFPGLTGANEVSGGAPAYARKTVAFATSSGGTRALTGTATFDVPAGTTARWFGLWAAGVFQGYSPNGGSPKEFVATPSTDIIQSPAHAYLDTQKVVFYNGTVPGGLTEGTVYFVRDATADSFKVAATSGGAAIDITSAGTSDCVVSAIAEDTYAVQDTHVMSGFTLGLPF